MNYTDNTTGKRVHKDVRAFLINLIIAVPDLLFLCLCLL